MTGYLRGDVGLEVYRAGKVCMELEILKKDELSKVTKSKNSQVFILNFYST